MSLSVFQHYPKESAIIGRILTGYGGLEYQLSHCLSAALGNRPSIFRAFYRLRGEQQRLEVADALMRPHYEEVGLADKYNETIGSMRWCRNIRNQYAHCQWTAYEDAGLFFTNMEDPAKKADGNITFKLYHVDEVLLDLQEKYCFYSEDWLAHLRGELERLRNGTTNHFPEAPKIIAQPPLYNPRDQHPVPPLEARGA